MAQKEDKKRSFSQIDYLVLIFLVLSIAIFVIIRYDIFNLNVQDPLSGTIQRLTMAVVIICVTWIVLHFIGNLFEKIGAPTVGRGPGKVHLEDNQLYHLDRDPCPLSIGNNQQP